MSDPLTLIVGGDSKVGKALADSLRKCGHPVSTTSRRATTDPNVISLDLADCDGWEPQRGVTSVVLAAAITNMEACRLDPQRSAQVNVLGPLALAQKCKRHGIFLVYLSSSTVFDGRTPFAQAEAPRCPINHYGRQKAMAEAELHALDMNVAIVRLTKVLEPRMPLFERWQQDLRNGKAIEPFDDMTIAPVPLACVVTVLRLIMEARLGGIWQISGDRDITYAAIAQQIARWRGANESLVQPVRARGSGKITEDFPPFTSLNIDRLRVTFGIQPPPVEWTVDAALRHD